MSTEPRDGNEAAVEVAPAGVTVAWVEAGGVRVEPAGPALRDEIAASVAKASSSRPSAEAADRNAAARALLRFGTYRPAGRGKPACEYLLNAAAAGAFPAISNVVDLANLASLESLLPVSLVDLDRAGTRDFRVRRGHQGESYVFNASGQTLELRDLLLLAGLPADVPCASAVKDSHATKVHEGTRRALAVVYAPASMRAEAVAAASRIADLLARHAGAAVRTGVAGA